MAPDEQPADGVWVPPDKNLSLANQDKGTEQHVILKQSEILVIAFSVQPGHKNRAGDVPL